MDGDVSLDLTMLAAMAPQAAELAARIEAGDLAACWDAELFLVEVDRATADARTFIARDREPLVVSDGSDGSDWPAKLAFEADDGLHHVISYLSGSGELQAVLDDSRADSEPDA